MAVLAVPVAVVKQILWVIRQAPCWSKPFVAWSFRAWSLGSSQARHCLPFSLSSSIWLLSPLMDLPPTWSSASSPTAYQPAPLHQDPEPKWAKKLLNYGMPSKHQAWNNKQCMSHGVTRSACLGACLPPGLINSLLHCSPGLISSITPPLWNISAKAKTPRMVLLPWAWYHQPAGWFP